MERHIQIGPQQDASATQQAFCDAFDTTVNGDIDAFNKDMAAGNLERAAYDSNNIENGKNLAADAGCLVTD